MVPFIKNIYSIFPFITFIAGKGYTYRYTSHINLSQIKESKPTKKWSCFIFLSMFTMQSIHCLLGKYWDLGVITILWIVTNLNESQRTEGLLSTRQMASGLLNNTIILDRHFILVWAGSWGSNKSLPHFQARPRSQLACYLQTVMILRFHVCFVSLQWGKEWLNKCVNTKNISKL